MIKNPPDITKLLKNLASSGACIKGEACSCISSDKSPRMAECPNRMKNTASEAMSILKIQQLSILQLIGLINAQTEAFTTTITVLKLLIAVTELWVTGFQEMLDAKEFNKGELEEALNMAKHQKETLEATLAKVASHVIVG